MERILPEHERNDINAKSVKKLFDAYYEKHYLDKTRAYAGIPELIRLLWEKDIRTAVVSNKPDEFVQRIVSQLFTDIPFDLVIGQSKAIPKKPDPTGVNQVLERLSVPKEECLYIGDSDVDVQTAQNAGIRCIGAAWGFRGEEELRNAGADAVVMHPMDVLELLGHE